MDLSSVTSVRFAYREKLKFFKNFRGALIFLHINLDLDIQIPRDMWLITCQPRDRHVSLHLGDNWISVWLASNLPSKLSFWPPVVSLFRLLTQLNYSKRGTLTTCNGNLLVNYCLNQLRFGVGSWSSKEMMRKREIYGAEKSVPFEKTGKMLHSCLKYFLIVSRGKGSGSTQNQDYVMDLLFQFKELF